MFMYIYTHTHQINAVAARSGGRRCEYNDDDARDGHFVVGYGTSAQSD